MADVLPATDPTIMLATEGSAEDATAEVSVPAATEKQPEQPEPPVSRGIYFVRVPRPTLADSGAINKLETELSACFTKLKAINNKFQVKKGEANELRKQLTLARSLRNGSSPEFDEKMTRLKQLREMRKGYLDKIQDYKAGRAGLECRTEEELDEKVAEMEHSIQHDGLTLNAEKQLVKNISKLKSQREKIREFQGAQEGLSQLEAEAKKLKAVIDEIDSEVNILRGERDQAKDIIDDLSKKLQAVNAVIDEYQSERQDIEVTKNEVQDQLKALRAENDEAMFEFRANRKLGVEIRDLVAEGKVEEAQKLAEEQVETYFAKFASDKAYKQEYLKLWGEQRRYAVSELLPESGNAAEAAPAAGKGGKGATGKGPAKPSAPLVPQGKMKAEALIAAALQEAGADLAAKRLAEPQQQQQPEPESSEEADEEPESKPEPPARRVVPGASDDLINARKKAPKATVKHVTELPVEPNYEYDLPVASTKEKQGGDKPSAEELKAQLREEQRRKAAEAEERKKRQQEQKAKKALQRQRAAEEAAAAAATAVKAAQHAAQLAAAAAADVDNASGTDGEREEPLEGEGAVVASTYNRSYSKKGKGHKGKQLVAAPPVAKVPIKKPAKPLKWYEQYQNELVMAVVALITLILAYMAITSK